MGVFFFLLEKIYLYLDADLLGGQGVPDYLCGGGSPENVHCSALGDF